MRKAVVSLVLVCLLGVVAVGGELSGRVDYGLTVSPQEAITQAQAALILEYHLNGLTFGMVGEFNQFFYLEGGPPPQLPVRGVWTHPDGLTDMTFGVRGVLGAVQFASYMSFGYISAIGGVQPAFRDWKNLAWTSIAGVDFWAMWGVEAVTYPEPLPSLSGYTLGLHGVAGDLEVWAEADFGASNLSWLMAYWDYDLDFIASTWYYCDWGDIDGSCDSSFSDLWVIAKYPFDCGSILSQLWIDCEGFESLSFAVRDIQIGGTWLYIDSFQISFQTDVKHWYIDLKLVVPEVFCIQPYFSLDLESSNTVIDGIELVGLTVEYSWDGITFLAAERLSFDSMISNDARLWLDDASGYEPSVIICREYPRMLKGVDEAFGIEVDSDACCGERLFGGLYVFFDHDLEDTSLFDWHSTRAVVEFGIGPSFDVGIGALFTHNENTLLTFQFTSTWGMLRIFDHDFCASCDDLN